MTYDQATANSTTVNNQKLDQWLKAGVATIAILVFVAIMAIYVVLDTPWTEETVREAYPELLVDARNFKGLYRDHDASTTGFRYVVGSDEIQAPAKVLSQLISQCEKWDWTVVERGESEVVLKGPTSWEFRAIYEPRTGTMFVGSKVDGDWSTIRGFADEWAAKSKLKSVDAMRSVKDP
jgi:hypothetical protein